MLIFQGVDIIIPILIGILFQVYRDYIRDTRPGLNEKT